MTSTAGAPARSSSSTSTRPSSGPTRESKGGCGDLGDFARLPRQTGRDQVPLDGTVRSDVFDRAELLAPDEQVVHQTRLLALRLRIPVANHDDPIAVVERQCRRDDLGEELERGNAHRDAERNRHTADRGQARVLDQHSDAELEIERRAVQPTEGTRVTLVL